MKEQCRARGQGRARPEQAQKTGLRDGAEPPRRGKKSAVSSFRLPSPSSSSSFVASNAVSKPVPHVPCDSSRALPASVYVHFPWCLAKCPYCDFVSYAKPRAEVDSSSYADAVLRELEARRGATGAREIRTIFFGGDAEPLRAERAQACARRHSRGLCMRRRPRSDGRVQSDVRSITERADYNGPGRSEPPIDRDPIRNSTPSSSASSGAFMIRPGLRGDRRGLASDVARVSTDLIFGLPAQTPADASAQATALAERESGGRRLAHLSCYQLTIEQGTQFGALAKRGRLPLADDGVVAEAFLAIDEALASRGLRHYEISNCSAVPGKERATTSATGAARSTSESGCAAYGMVRTDRARGGSSSAGASSPPNEAPGLRYRNPIDPRAHTRRRPIARRATGWARGRNFDLERAAGRAGAPPRADHARPPSRGRARPRGVGGRSRNRPLHPREITRKLSASSPRGGVVRNYRPACGSAGGLDLGRRYGRATLPELSDPAR